jgi:uncharacterized protein (TIGR02453 family)
MARTAAAPAFLGFAPEAFGWFAGLQADNSRAWFAAHRNTYERAVRGALEAMLEELAGELGGRVKLFRQHRDVRFSADKAPYKTRTYGVIADRPDRRGALYAQLSAGGLFAGSGYHVLAADQLARMREAIVDDAAGAALESAVEHAHAAGVETYGEALKTAPRGYPRDHARVHLLRHKALFGGRRLDAGPEGITRDAALAHARGTWAACAPLDAWLDEHVGPSAETPVTPARRRAARPAPGRPTPGSR